MRYIFSLLAILFIVGCSSIEDVDVPDIDKRLLKKDKEYIYDIKMQDIVEELKIKPKLFEEFPFISKESVVGFKGHYSPEFYKNHKVTLKSLRIDKVDFWSLKENPKSVDIIYTKEIIIDKYKKVSNDLFTNLCYAYNITQAEQEILLSWIENGGVLWMEGSLYRLDRELNNTYIGSDITFLGKRVYQHVIKKDVEKKAIVYDRLKTNSFFSDIKSLEVHPKKYDEICFLIDGLNVISRYSQKLVNITKYEKGLIVSMLPFEYTTLYRDGELLRWNILEIIKNRELLEIKKKPKKEIQKKVKVKTHPKKEHKQVVKTEVLQEGSCIQLFTAYGLKRANKELQKAKDFPLARVEKRGKAYTGRVGMYKYVRDARKTLDVLKKSYPNAFIRRCSLTK
jgi:hypothetical protein